MRTYCIEESLVNAQSDIIENESVSLVQRRIELNRIEYNISFSFPRRPSVIFLLGIIFFVTLNAPICENMCL